MKGWLVILRGSHLFVDESEKDGGKETGFNLSHFYNP